MTSSKDDDLWALVVQDITPIAHNKINLQKPISKKNLMDDIYKRHMQERPLVYDKPNLKVHKEHPRYFEKKAIEGRIDLHGYTCSRAEEALDRFFFQAQQQGKRTVIVITGKGEPKECNAIPNPGPYGVLRTYTCQWLEQNPHYIVCYSEANTEHGGLGAFYVHVRRASF